MRPAAFPARGQPLPRALAVRIDRLGRAAHAFHRFAHHPLCDRYASELVPLGRKTRVCRGCLLTGAGGGFGLLGGALLPWPSGTATVLALALVLPLALGPPWLPKSLKRFAPAALLAAVLAGAPWPWRMAAAAVMAGALVAYQQRGPNRTPCATCPERSREVCSGFAPIVRREQAFQRRAHRLTHATRSALSLTATIDSRVRRPL